MDIKLPIKLHNRFDIEVKDVITGEIVQRGQAENIILNNFFTSANVWVTNATNNYVGKAIIYGTGTGVLSPTRTTLFTYLGRKNVSLVEKVYNTPPIPAYYTRKIVLAPSDNVGAILTEVGLGDSDLSSTIYTHALIKDSEGNPLALGPKTDTQEITIYATVYVQLDLPDGMTLINIGNNAIYHGLCGYAFSSLRNGLSTNNAGPTIWVNGSRVSGYFGFAQDGIGKITKSAMRLQTNEANGKIKNIGVRAYASPNGNTYAGDCFDINLITFAQNNNPMWSGYNFDNRQIGIGTGAQTVFNLTWDEARLDKAKAVYVDGVEQTSGVTWATGSITFDIAPVDQAIITADYWVDYIPKDTDHVLDCTFSILYAEGV